MLRDVCVGEPNIVRLGWLKRVLLQMRKLGVVQGVYVTLLIFLALGKRTQVHCIVDCIGIAVQVLIGVVVGVHGIGSLWVRPNNVRFGWKNYESVAMYIVYHIVMYKSIPLVTIFLPLVTPQTPTRICPYAQHLRVLPLP